MKLSRKERITVVLGDIDGRSSIETAAMLKAPAAIVRSRTHSARRKLAARLKPKR